ncbi:MAG: hydrolase, partial [Bacteroidota bacterium]
MNRFLPLTVLLLCNIQLASQPANTNPGVGQPPTATAPRFEQRIQLDGKLDEAIWYLGKPADEFWETFPSDTARCGQKTEIYFGYDDNNLYVGAKCYSIGDDYVITSLRRDFRAGGNDNITFLFNTFRDKTNAIVFGMNPFGVTREALIYNGGESGGDFREEW